MNDCIFALATPNSKSALHLHRLSGNGVLNLISSSIFAPSSEHNFNFNLLKDGKPISRYVVLKNHVGDIIDDVIITFFPNPKSFTGEDVIEISTHGNPLISNLLHSHLRKCGLRDAKPGEFTQRAMLNGKLDLTQAEGINQLIHAETMGDIECARNNVEGLLSKETLQIRHDVIEILAYLEAHIDFAPDEVGQYEPQNLIPKVKEIQNKLLSLFHTYENGLKIREGIKIVLCGKPNSGKSSLYNALLKYDRAIVTNIPGTTRDVLEDKLLIDNKEFVLLDTAGIRQTTDEVEKIGVARSLSSVKQADIVCYLIAATQLDNVQWNSQIQQEINEFKNTVELKGNQKLIVLLTKKDLLSYEFIEKLNKSNLIISQDEFDDLKNKLLELHHELLQSLDTKKSPMLISQRQKDKVFNALEHIKDAEKLIQIADYPEKIASIINGAKLSLEEIVGEISVDNVFEKVFSTFCIGK